MKNLTDLLKFLKNPGAQLPIALTQSAEYLDFAIETRGSLEKSFSDITNKSGTANSSNIFFALPGTVHDGHSFIESVIKASCHIIICERFPNEIHPDCTYVKVKSIARVWAYSCHWFFDFPANQMIVAGVTGTNGKTTVATTIFTLWRKLGISSGLFSTIENKINDEVIPTEHTTPDAYDIVKTFRTMKQQGVTHAVMEVSSHSLAQERISGIRFSVGIFTNLTQDHLDFHKTMQNYASEKRKLFSVHMDKHSVAIINSDDQWNTVISEGAKGILKTYGTTSKDYLMSNIDLSVGGSTWSLNQENCVSPCIGLFNVYNMTAVAIALEFTTKRNLAEIVPLLKDAHSPKGRCEIAHPLNPTVVVDYAHTPDGLEKILETMRFLLPEGKKLIVVFGCGGNRDTGKRPIMGAIASKYADFSIVTSDNPRNEDPVKIIEDVKAGMSDSSKALFLVDRAEAVSKAISLFPNDVIVIAGKGHEDYQVIGTTKIHFSDQEEISKALSKK